MNTASRLLGGAATTPDDDKELACLEPAIKESIYQCGMPWVSSQFKAATSCCQGSRRAALDRELATVGRTRSPKVR